MSKKRQAEPPRRSEDWTTLVRRGDFIVLAEPSMSTATEMKRDYNSLVWCTRQLEQWAYQAREKARQPTLREAKEAFLGTIIVGDKNRVPYVTDEELQKQIESPQAPSVFSEEIVGRRWGFTPSTTASYLRRKSQSTRSKP